MTFTTLAFVVFLVIVFAAYWSLLRGRNLLIVGASYVFYGWWDARFCGLMLASSLIDYAAGLGIQRSRKPWVRRAVLAAAMTSNLGILAFFKYFNFFAESLAAAAASVGWHLDFVTLNVVLPVGISFYTFQTMSYSIDVYRGDLRATSRLVDYMAYVSFFPQLVAGPIERATRLLPHFQAPRSFDPVQASEGCRYILWGFFKKLALADNLSLVVDERFASVSTQSGPALAVATVGFAFQIYCDFSAYSDIATGTAKLFGIELMRNFAYPYFSRSVPEFWRRWHISLSTWFADYVYRPLGGSRVARARRVGNVLTVFLLSGLWHGAAWHFVAWGALNGVAVLPAVLWPGRTKQRAGDVPGGKGLWPGLRAVGAMAATFAFTCVAWVFFRAPSIGDALVALERMRTQVLTASAYPGALSGVEALVPILVLFVLIEWTQRDHRLPLQTDAWPTGLRWAAYTGLLWYTLYLMPQVGVQQFIYFQF